VTDAAIAAVLPADRRLSMTAAEHRDRAHDDAALDRLLPRSPASEAERARVRRAALDRLAVSRARSGLRLVALWWSWSSSGSVGSAVAGGC
jgi:hypothetical protein